MTLGTTFDWKLRADECLAISLLLHVLLFVGIADARGSGDANDGSTSLDDLRLMQSLLEGSAQRQPTPLVDYEGPPPPRSRGPTCVLKEDVPERDLDEEIELARTFDMTDLVASLTAQRLPRPAPEAPAPHEQGPSIPWHRPRDPIVRMESLVQNGGRLPAEVIRRIVRLNFGRVRSCYDQGLRHDPALRGRVLTEFRIAADGSVAMSREVASDLPDLSVRQCVVRMFTILSFPSPEGGPIDVRFPIAFEPPAHSGRER